MKQRCSVPAKRLFIVVSTVLFLAGCTMPAGAAGGVAGVPKADWLPQVVAIPAGAFIEGSDRASREAAYRLDEKAYGHSATRRQGWYEGEPKRHRTSTGAFMIMKTPVTNAQYRAFVTATGHRLPDVSLATWQGYGLIHPFERTRRHAWSRGADGIAAPPPGRPAHPVVLVDHADAVAYAGWLSRVSGQHWRLPTEKEWEKAQRGVDGRRFPWGDDFRPEALNSADLGPFDTTPVDRYPQGRGPFGLLDGAGQVYEWTATPAGKARFIVKGGSWDDKGCGICRPAARHSRPSDLRHILIGFRLVRDYDQGAPKP